MKIKKICEYLCEIGILELKDVNNFLQIFSQIDNNKCKKELDKLKLSLFSYFNLISKNDNQLFKICRNIIDSFVNHQIVSKYKSLNTLNNIFKNKINLFHNLFFYKLKIFILKKKKNKFIVQPVYYKEKKFVNNKNIQDKKDEDKMDNINYKKQSKFTFNDINNNNPKDRITADDVRECTFSPNIHEYKPHKQNKRMNENVKSYTYYSPSFNIFAKMPQNKSNKNNKLYLNKNCYNNTDNINNIFPENRDNIYLLEPLNIYNNNKYNKFNKSSLSTLNINNNYPAKSKRYINYDNDYINDNYYLYKLNKDYNPIKYRANTPIQSSTNPNEIFNNFLLKQDKHVKDVEKKILNLKIEQRNKEEQECSFSPEIHHYNGQNRPNEYLQNFNNYPDTYSSYQNNANSNISNNFNIDRTGNLLNNYNAYSNRNNRICPKFEGSLSQNDDTFSKELYNIRPQTSKNRKRPNSVSQQFFNKLSNENSEKKIRLEELRQKIEQFTFSPKINYNDKYKVKGSFEERQNEYIQNKKKLRNQKEEDEKMFVEEMNRMYMPKNKSNKNEIINRLYNKEQIDKIKEKNKKEETKKKKIINWKNRNKENNKKKEKDNNNNQKEKKEEANNNINIEELIKKINSK